MTNLCKDATVPRKVTEISMFLRCFTEVTLWVVAFFLIFAIKACTSGSDIDIPERLAALDNLVIIQPYDASYTLHLEENLYLNQLNEEHTQNLWALYSDRNRNFYWADNFISQIHQYSPDGIYIRSFGQKGQGPGEFENLSWSTVHENRLYAFEYAPQSAHAFDTNTGDFIESFTIEQPPGSAILSRSSKLLVQNDSTMLGIPNFIMGPRELHDDSLTVFLYGTDGRLINTEFFRFRKPGALEGTRGGGRFSSGGSFTANSDIAVLPGDGGFVYSHASEPVFYFYDFEGDYQKAFYLALDPIPLTREQIDYAIDTSNPMIDLGSAVQHARSIPDTWPYWQGFFVSDDGNLWINVFSDPPYGRELWVISPDGVLLARKKFEREGGIRFVDSDYLYTTSRPDGIFEIRRYQVSFLDK
jgi:hypothetical protein